MDVVGLTRHLGQIVPASRAPSLDNCLSRVALVCVLIKTSLFKPPLTLEVLFTVWNGLEAIRLCSTEEVNRVGVSGFALNGATGWQRTVLSPVLVLVSIADRGSGGNSGRCGPGFVWISVIRGARHHLEEGAVVTTYSVWKQYGLSVLFPPCVPRSPAPLRASSSSGPAKRPVPCRPESVHRPLAGRPVSRKETVGTETLV